MVGLARGIGSWLCVTLLLGTAACDRAPWMSSRDRVMKERLDGSPPRRPRFLRDAPKCRPASSDEVRIDRSMLGVAEASATTRSWHSPPLAYVVHYFAGHWRLTANASQPRCAPSEETFAALNSLMSEANWPAANTLMNDLGLLERLPPTERRAAGLAQIAFLEWIPPSDDQGEDTRPYARILLAEQGEFASPWQTQALNAIGSETRLETSAAYLAVAIAPEQALPLVEKAMAEALLRSQTRRVRAHSDDGRVAALQDDDANRLIELGYAMARGGSRADAYSAPVIAMLDEPIARSMPPFGLSSTPPTEFCRIAAAIGGRAAAAADARSFCAAGYRGGDGAPRPY